MRYTVPAIALFGLVVLALIPVPVVWGLVIACVSLALIVGMVFMRVLDATLMAVLRRHAQARQRRRETHRGTGIARARVKTVAAQ